MTTWIGHKCIILRRILIRPGIFEKYFLSYPHKNTHQRKLGHTKCLLFNLWNYRIYSYAKNSYLVLTIWQNWFFGQCHNSKIAVKSKHWVCLSFLRWVVSMREQEQIFFQIFRAYLSKLKSYRRRWEPYFFSGNSGSFSKMHLCLRIV